MAPLRDRSLPCPRPPASPVPFTVKRAGPGTPCITGRLLNEQVTVRERRNGKQILLGTLVSMYDLEHFVFLYDLVKSTTVLESEFRV